MVALITLLACQGPDDAVQHPRDRDGDGSPARLDCDDGDASIHPDADEIWYDGVDQDCDGRDDDQDGDGFELARDCDDEDASVHPAAVEIWYDGLDQDCDGHDDDQDEDGFLLADDCDDELAEVNPAAEEIWYDGVDQDCDGRDDDQDGDGFELAEDCDDEDAGVYPAAEETCDGIDNDCDDEVDESEDADGDGYTRCNGDCDDGDYAVNPGATEVAFTAVDEDCNGLVDWDAMDGWDADLYWEGDEDLAWSYLVRDAMIAVPDVTGDGVGDLAVTGSGPIALLGTDGVEGEVRLVSEEAHATLNSSYSEGSGWWDFDAGELELIGDIDSDGLQDLALGAAGRSSNGVLVFSMADLQGGGELRAEDAVVDVVSTSPYGSWYPDLASAHDLDGDGIDEMVAGEKLARVDGNSSWGRVFVWELDNLETAGAVVQDDADSVIEGDGDRGWFGLYVFTASDLDGDGYDTLVVVEDGITWLIDGDHAASGSSAGVGSVAFSRIDHPDGSEYADVRSPGDIDGDGRADLLMFNPSDDLEIDGTYWEGRVDVHLDLWAGGTFEDVDAAAMIGNSVAVDEGVNMMAGPAPVRSEGQDMAFAGYHGVAFVPVEELPTSGTLDLATWPDTLQNGGTWFAGGCKVDQCLVLEDLDADGDADLAAGNFVVGADFYTTSYENPPGVVSVFHNPLY